MAAITKVPNGPLIKKKGPFKGSGLKSGGTVKKAQEGATMSPYMQKRAAQQLVKEKNIRARDSILNRNAAAKGITREQVQAQQVADKKWIQSATASIKKRGTAGKCTPISKKSCTGKAKTLALTFKKIAKSNKKK
jgi:hypothetical protein